MPEPVIATAAENGKKRDQLKFDWLADVPKLTLRTVKKRGRLKLEPASLAS